MGSVVNDEGLKKLEYLSLVSKVCTELETHLGFGDKILAEFITEIGRNCGTVDEFDEKLKENGAEMHDYFVRTLLTIIHAILPPKVKSKSDKDSRRDGAENKKSSFSALKIDDGKERVKELEREIEREVKERQRNEEKEVRRHRDGDRDRRERHRDDRRERRREREEDERGDYKE